MRESSARKIKRNKNDNQNKPNHPPDHYDRLCNPIILPAPVLDPYGHVRIGGVGFTVCRVVEPEPRSDQEN